MRLKQFMTSARQTVRWSDHFSVQIKNGYNNGKTTGLTGLAVAKHPHQTLKVLYEKTLRTLGKMPATAAYRKHTEKIICERIELVKTEPDLTKLENKINCGQLEEVILQAERELMLSRKMLAWKPWEPLISEAPANQWKWPI